MDSFGLRAGHEKPQQQTAGPAPHVEDLTRTQRGHVLAVKHAEKASLHGLGHMQLTGAMAMAGQRGLEPASTLRIDLPQAV